MDTCYLCFKNEDEEIMDLPCGHQFHKCCFNEWCKYRSSIICPLCFEDYTLRILYVLNAKCPTSPNPNIVSKSKYT